MDQDTVETEERSDSLKKRYLAKLSVNLIGLAVGIVTQAIIPRGLGPTAYGNYSFLTSFFSRVADFLDMGTSIGFYTKLSQRQKDFGLVSFYLSFTGLLSLLVLMFVGCAHLTNIYAILLPDQKLFYIYLAALWGIFTWLVKILNKMGDAYGITVSTEIAKTFQRGLGLVLVLVLFLTNQLNMTHFFLYHYIILIFLGLAFIWVMERNGYSLRQNWRLPLSKIKAYTKEFYNYSHPLFVYALVVLIVGTLDRWLLQFFGGSVEQGFYGLSYRIGAVCFLFTSAMTPLITREFAIAYGKKDLGEIARLFRRYIPMLYAIAAYFACFIAVQASKVTFIMGGGKFQQATMAVMIMSFYPIHQTYGQLSGSVFFATGQTKLYRNIGITFMVLGLPISYFLIAPVEMMGLNAGSTGLAIKMVAIQFIAVNTQLYFNTRLLKLRFWRYFGHQIGSMGVLLALAFLAGLFVDCILEVSDNVIINFVTSGIVYSILVTGLVISFPPVFGLTKKDIKTFKKVVFKKFMEKVL